MPGYLPHMREEARGTGQNANLNTGQLAETVGSVTTIRSRKLLLASTLMYTIVTAYSGKENMKSLKIKQQL
jgi:hypothetical protein